MFMIDHSGRITLWMSENDDALNPNLRTLVCPTFRKISFQMAAQMINLGRDLFERIIKRSFVTRTGFMSPLVQSPFTIHYIPHNSSPQIFGFNDKHRVVRDQQVIQLPRFVAGLKLN